MNRGIFISFEGVEGCGKSTQIKRLMSYFKELSKDCILTREPGGTKLGEDIRQLLLRKDESAPMCSRTELLLFEASRAQHVQELIQPALNEGKIVLCDRFFDSSTAYQGAARKLKMAEVDWLNKFAIDELMPDITIILDIDVKEGLSRAMNRDGKNSDRMGSEKIDFYEDVRNGFLNIAKEEPSRVKIINANQKEDDVFNDILKLLNENFDVK